MGEQQLTITITGGGPWGLRLQGGKDFGAPLTIARVTPAGKADRANVRPNDIITAINGQSTVSIAHLDAQNLVKGAGTSLSLQLVRGRDPSAGSFPSSPASGSGASSPGITSTYKPTSATSPPPGQPSTVKKSFQSTAPAVAAHAAARKTSGGNLSRNETDAGSHDPSRRSSHQSPLFMKVQAATGVADDEDEFDLPPPPPDLSAGDNPTSPTIPSSTFNKLQSQLEQMGTDDAPHPSVLSSGHTQQPARTSASVSTSFRPTAGQPRRSSGEYQRSVSPPNQSHTPAAMQSPSSGAGANLAANLAKLQKQTGPRGAAADRTAICGACNQEIKGSYVTALGKPWHPDHFACSSCSTSLRNSGFMEDNGRLFCEKCYLDFFASKCDVCKKVIKGESISALNKTFHSACFCCARCTQPLAGKGFHVEDGLFYCKEDYEAMFAFTCKGCGQSMNAGETWLEALDGHWHENCFVCTMCKVPLHGGKFFAKLGRPYCKTHA